MPTQLSGAETEVGMVIGPRDNVEPILVSEQVMIEPSEGTPVKQGLPTNARRRSRRGHRWPPALFAAQRLVVRFTSGR